MTLLPALARAMFAALCIAAALCAQDDRTKQVDAIFQQWNNSTSPGAAVSVIDHGRLILEKGYGIADLEYDVPIKPDTIFHVASVSKQFSAMAIVLLERDGKLSVDDDIRKYLRELPDYGHTITIRNLLQHTSGIRDQWQTLGLAGWSLEDVITQDQILRMLFRQKELNFTPGAEHLYSNGGYTLVAEIVSRVSGKPFPEFCASRIFKPLGMNHTHFHQDLHQVVKNRSYSYEGTAGAYTNAPLNYANVGATSLFTTATDLTKWLDNFREPKVGGKAAIARMLEQGVLNDGKKIDYALGVSVGKYRGLPTVSHSGGDAGFRSFVAWYPEQQFGIAVVSNFASFNPVAAANKVAAVYLEPKMTAERVKPAPVTRASIDIDPATVALSPDGGMQVKITQPASSKTDVDFQAYTGAYWSEELETQYTFSVRNGKLIATQAHHGITTLIPVTKDSFSSDKWFMSQVRFLRENQGRITAVTLGGGRIKGIRFTKK